MSAEQNLPTTEESAEPTGISSLGELLAAQEEPETSGDNEEKTESSGSDNDKVNKFNDLAGKLGIELNDLYNLEVSLSEDGEPVTIEQLKDSYKGKASYELEQAEWEERKLDQERELMRAQNELTEILSMLPKNAVKPEVLEGIRSRHSKQVAEEKRLTLEVIPEWKNEDKRLEEISGMSEQLVGYGFPPNYLEQVVSHKQLKYIRDNYLRKLRMDKAIAAVKAGKPDKQPRKSVGKPPKKSDAGGKMSLKSLLTLE
jgi:hypothetical protein